MVTRGHGWGTGGARGGARVGTVGARVGHGGVHSGTACSGNTGQIMPPKSTWFEPKARSGLVVKIFENN